jgi:hypothetical protein
MKKDYIVASIEDRIRAEYRKYSHEENMDWAKIAALKIFNSRGLYVSLLPDIINRIRVNNIKTTNVIVWWNDRDIRSSPFEWIGFLKEPFLFREEEPIRSLSFNGINFHFYCNNNANPIEEYIIDSEKGKGD